MHKVMKKIIRLQPYLVRTMTLSYLNAFLAKMKENFLSFKIKTGAKFLNCCQVFERRSVRILL